MKFEGLYTAIITPFSADGSKIDYDVYAALIERQIKAGCGIVPCGTTGESPTLSHDEHAELIRRTVEIVNGRVQVIAGTGSNSTAEAIDLTRQACEAGVDAVMLVNPYYNKPTQEGLYLHFKAIAEKSTKPVVLYNIRGRTAVNVEPETFLRLCEIPNIACVKEASGDLNQMARIIGLTKGKMSLLSGDDNLTPAVMAVGGSGVISVASNIYPVKLSKMVKYYLAGDFKAGNEIFYQMIELMNGLFFETNPIPVKTLAARLGLCSPAMRLPLSPMSADKKERLFKLHDLAGADQ